MRFAIVMLLLGGCVFPGNSSKCGNQACTDLFAMVTVTAVDAADRPIDGLTTRTTYVATGAPVLTSPALGNGVYVVVDDNFLGMAVDGEQHSVRFEAMGTQGTATADYVIRAGECSCHVEKISGPDRLVLQ